MKVTFDPRAVDDLQRIYAWIAEDSPRAAAALIDRIEAHTMLLQTPGLEKIGRPGVVGGTRELVEWPYIIVYEVDTGHSEVVVVAVMHGAQDRKREPD